MRRFAFVTSVLLACTMLLGAHAGAQVEFGVGPIGGVNFGTGSFSPPKSYPPGQSQGSRKGLVFGFAAELGFEKTFYLDAQPCYVQKGFTVTDPDQKETVAVDELVIPLLFKVKFLDGMIRPYVYVGPEMGIVLSATDAYTIGRLTQGLLLVTYSPDFAVNFGGGAEFNVMPKLGITAEVRYSLGLENLIDWGASYQLGVPYHTTTAMGVQVLIGAIFHVM